MNFGFVTCVHLGLSCMQAIYDVGGRLSLAITLPNEKSQFKSGRVFLDDFCNANSIPLLKCNHINDDIAISTIKLLDIDWLFIVGWSQIANSNILSAPKNGVLGMHPTLLPDGRGRASIPWAILKGYKQTGVTLFKLDGGVDTGPVAAQYAVSIDHKETANSLYKKIELAHIQLMKEFFPNLLNNNASFVNQDNSLATEWSGRRPEDGKINLSGSIFDAELLIRALDKPYPGAFYFLNGQKIIVWRATIVDHQPSNCEYFIKFHDGFLLIDEYSIG